MEEVLGEVVGIKDGMVLCDCADGVRLLIPIHQIEENAEVISFKDEIANKLYKVSTNNFQLIRKHSLEVSDSDVPSLPSGKKEKFIWSSKDAKLLLDQYEFHMDLVKARKLKIVSKVWAPIAAVLQSHNCNVDAVQVENKFKSLRREYMKVQHNNSTGRDKKYFEFEEQLDTILGYKHSVTPRHLIGSISGERMEAAPASIQSSSAVEVHSNEESQVDTVEMDEAQEIGIEAALQDTSVTSDNSTNIRKSRKGATAKKIEECNEIMCSIVQKMEVRQLEKRKHQEDVLKLYKEEVEAAKRFREEIIETKKEKNKLLRSFLEKK